MATPSTLVGGRLDFARLCNDRGYKVAVEIGTDRGIFARDFLDRWRGEILYCVDIWEPYPEMDWPRWADLTVAILNTSRHSDRIRIIKLPSLLAATAVFKLPSFVYIDGDHRQNFVEADIRAWWGKLLPGGILAGDDYDSEHQGVIEAVDQFSAALGLRVQLTTDYNRPPSWFIEKPL